MLKIWGRQPSWI